MPPITALLHTENDALRLGRALETLLPCSEILIVDHQSSDGTQRIAHEYGARVISASERSAPDQYAGLASNEWIFCIEPRESINEALQASLFEWRVLPEQSLAPGATYSVSVREETSAGWLQLRWSETHLVPRNWALWRERPMPHQTSTLSLTGDLLRFAWP